MALPQPAPTAPAPSSNALWAWLSVLTYLAGALLSVLNPVMIPGYLAVVALGVVAIVLLRRPSSPAARRVIGVLLLLSLVVGVVVAFALIIGAQEAIAGLDYASYFLFVAFFAFPAVTAFSLLRPGRVDPRR